MPCKISAYVLYEMGVHVTSCLLAQYWDSRWALLYMAGPHKLHVVLVHAMIISILRHELR